MGCMAGDVTAAGAREARDALLLGTDADPEKGGDFLEALAVGQVRPVARAAADAPRIRAGKRAFFIPKQLGFEQILWYRGTVNAYERKEFAGTGMMNGLGKELFAGTAVAGDQHRKLIG
mgnify:CR=1 FL=1